MTTIITNDDDDDETNINDYSVILLKVYFLCFVATELFFLSPLFLKKKEFCKGTCDPLLNRSYRLNPCWCWWTVPIIFACSPCIAMSLLSLNYSICIDFLCFRKKPLFGCRGPAPCAGEGGAEHGCTDSCAFSWFFENCTQTPSRSA